MEIFDYYIDDGYSGTSFKRPDFERLLLDMKNKKINCIIVKDLSRFARNHIEADMYLENIFPALNIRFISVTEKIDSFKNPDLMDSLIVPFKNLLNDAYAKDISKKVRSALTTKRLNGEFIGVSAPYGYIKNPKDKHKFIVDKEAAYNVKIIFNMILIGKSRKEIVQKLNDRNVLTPSMYKIGGKVENENLSFSKKWDVAMITRILRNESYTGILIQGVKKKVNYRINKLVDVSRDEWIRTPNHHEPIISKEKFDEVQKILNKKIKSNKNNEIDLFLGFLKCSHCGEYLTVRRSKDNVYYYCKSYIKDKSCKKYSINRKKLEKYVIEKINNEVKNSIDELNRKILNEYVDVIYVIDKNEIKIRLKKEV